MLVKNLNPWKKIIDDPEFKNAIGDDVKRAKIITQLTSLARTSLHNGLLPFVVAASMSGGKLKMKDLRIHLTKWEKSFIEGRKSYFDLKGDSELSRTSNELLDRLVKNITKILIDKIMNDIINLRDKV